MLTFPALDFRRIRSDERVTLETSAYESLYGGQITLLSLLIKPNIRKFYFCLYSVRQYQLDSTISVALTHISITGANFRPLTNFICVIRPIKS